MERDGRAHSVLVSGSLDARVRWLEFPHIPEFLSKTCTWGDREYGGGEQGICGVYLGRETPGISREFEISVGHTAVASITLSFSFQTRFPARLNHVDSGEWMDGWPPGNSSCWLYRNQIPYGVSFLLLVRYLWNFICICKNEF